MRRYDEMHEAISWEVSIAEPEIPGLRQYYPAQVVPGRKDLQVTTLSEDRVSNVTFTLPPFHQPNAGDRMDGAEVMEVTSTKDVFGKTLRWVAYAKQ